MTTQNSKVAVPQVAVDDIGSDEDFLAAIDNTIKDFDDNDLVEGTVVKVDRDEVLLDIGYKTEGVIPARELSIKNDVDPSEQVKVGDKIEALVLTKEDKEGRLILSKKRAQYERAWADIEKIKEADGVVSGKVIEVVKGGLILDIGLRGFLPASLVEMRRVRDLDPYIGQELDAKIIELDKNRNNVVLSRRAFLEQSQSEVRSTFLNELAVGQVREGHVSSIVNFGAFVDLGGVDGLVHVSELSWKHIDHPSEVVTVGDPVTVEVLEVNHDRERVSLSLKATQEDPWERFARTHALGQVVPGKVTKLVPFGAFVRVADGIEGLIHISELAVRHVDLAEQVVSVGDTLYVKIIDIDLERRRISLSLKQANDGVDPDAEDFDPALYGMTAEYDEEGNYKYPEGFDPETNEWLEGHDEQRQAWEAEYAKAQDVWTEHKKQVAEHAKADAEAAATPQQAAPEEQSNFSSAPAKKEAPQQTGTLASDEALTALREKLTGGNAEE
ncbi:MAG: 30S ribosomal protein S1 [Micrococcaceae bacterium]